MLILPQDKNPPRYVSVVGNELKPITKFRLELFGVKAEMPTSTIAINQSQNDRRAVPYEPEE